MRTDEEIQKRIDYEVIVDCYDDMEVRLSWFTHMENWLQFPFSAFTDIKKRDASFKRKKIDVLEMASDENFGQDIMLEAAYTEYIFLVPMLKLIDIEAEEETLEAIEDWKYWRKENRHF